MNKPQSARQIAAQRSMQRQPDTGPLQPVSNALAPAIPSVLIIHIGSMQPALRTLTPYSEQCILTGFQMAYEGRFIRLHECTYRIVNVFPDVHNPNRIMARLLLER